LHPPRAAGFRRNRRQRDRQAHHWIEAASKRACHEKKDFRTVLSADSEITAHLSVDTITNLLEPMAYQGASQALIDLLLISLDRK
jgi:3-carboxy-cis,cis-muconate cycloisomerase